MSLWQKLLGGGKRTESASDEPAAENPRKEMANQAVPYRIDERPMPAGDDLETLLPRQVGSYLREPIRPPVNIHKDPIYANYRSGLSVVFVELGICGDASSAKMALSTAKAETDAEFPDAPQAFSIKGEPAYFKATTKLGALLAWTRGGYYFSAHAKGGEADLAPFMEAFPY